MIDLSIVIVSWNTKDLLKECLESIVKNTTATSYEIYVVDNNSSDETCAMVSSEFPNVKLIENKYNAGFAKANNQAVELSDSKYILLLNPDTIVLPNAIDRMLKYIKANSNVGIVGCKLLNPDKTLQDSCRRFPTIKTYASILLRLHIVMPNLKCLKSYFMKDMDYNIHNEVDQVMGAALMYRTDVIAKKSYLDSDYWIWFEEVDFCYKVKKNGYKTVYIPDAEIIHYKAQSFNQLYKVEQQRVFNRSLLQYFKKNGTKKEVIMLKIIFPVSIAISFFMQKIKELRKRG